jgi:glycosyltransferase involved in cell wall biosynthesis
VIVSQRKIAILFPAFFGGGAEFVTAWMLESLKAKYRISLFTFSRIDFSKLNSQFGTTLSKEDIDVRVIYPFLGFLSNPQSYHLMTIRQHFLASYFRKVCLEFDLSIAAFNEMDLGRPGIQYIHVPLFGHGNEMARRILNYPTSPVRTVYQRTCEFLTGYSNERMKRNITLTNSQWTANLIKKSYGIDAQILHPLVFLAPIETSWEDRENGFILSGRLTPDKNIETAIEIIRRVRQKQHEVHLHIVSSGYDSKYRNKIMELRERNAQWLFLHENLSRAEYTQILSHYRYGIHARANETFGISIAEMAYAGCIPFVPSMGGQVEITGNNPALQFETIDEAVNKICEILLSPDHQEILRNSLSARKELFSPNHFRDKLMLYINQAIN